MKMQISQKRTGAWKKKSLGAVIGVGLLAAPLTYGTDTTPDFFSVPDDVVCTQDGYYAHCMERHSLLSITDEFAKTHPTIMMSAPQIILSMIKSQGVEEKYLPGYGKVPVYNIFSRSNPVSNGKRIIGHYDGIAAVVNGIESQAKGERSGSKVPLLTGTHGTGKSEFRVVLANALKNLGRDDKRFFMYEISWNLELLRNIPDLKNYLKVYQFEKELRSPLHSSPVALMPKFYQDKLKQTVGNVVRNLAGDVPLADLELDPLSKDIRDKIITHVLTQPDDEFVQELLSEIGVNPQEHWGPKEELLVLNQFASTRRYLLGQNKTCPLIDAQAKEVDIQGLIISENPILRAMVDPSNVWAWNYNSAVLNGNRNLLFLDEFFRNEHSLRDLFLGILESRKVTYGGSPEVPVDAVIIAATNSESLDEAKQDPTSGAQINRMRKIPFEWAVHPGEIAQILLYMNGKGMRMQKLAVNDETDGKENKWMPIDLDLLFPEQVLNAPMQTPDGNYRLRIGQGENAVDVSPHTLMFMADFISTTRMKTSVEEAKQVKNSSQILNTPEFRDPIARLKVLKGQKTISDSQQRDLYALSQLLREGSFGLSARAVGTWLSESIREAARGENDYTLTPVVLRTVFQRLMIHDALECPDIDAATEWIDKMDMVAKGVLIPSLRDDIYGSFQQDGHADSIYQEVMMEIITLAEDPSADRYEDDGSIKIINKDRLTEISKIYQDNTGRALAHKHLATLFLNKIVRAKGGMIKKHPDLLKAVNEYLARSIDTLVNVKDLLEMAQGNSGTSTTVKDKYFSVKENLELKGYNPRAILDALQIIKEYEEKKSEK